MALRTIPAMALKGKWIDEMRRIIVVVMIFCSSIISGCLGTEDYCGPMIIDNNLTSCNINFTISTDFNVYSKDSKNINLNLLLINEDFSMELETYQFYYPNVEIINPKGYNFTIFHGNITVEPNYELIKAGGEITNTIDLKSSNYFNGSSFHPILIDWTIVGIYECKVNAYGLMSNQWKFKIE